MLKYFKRKKEVKEFKKKIKGFFDDWEMDKYSAKKGTYEVPLDNDFFWINKILASGNKFLLSFNQWERELLLEELKASQQERYLEIKNRTRKETYKEFNLN